MNLENKIVVITGGAKGFGKYIADDLIERGATVIVTSLSEEPQSWHERVFGLCADARKEDDSKKIMVYVLEKFGRIDIWINNAGVWYPMMPIEQIDMDRVHDVFETNVFGLMYGSRVAMIQMRKQGYGTIVNIISSSALSGRANIAAYSASKFAADGFTKSLRLELNGSGVKVISVYPGGMKTNLFDEAKPADFDTYMDPREVAQKIVQNIELDSPEEEQILKRPQ